MDCNKNVYVNKMESKGFEVIQDQKLSVMMTGTYDGENVTLLIGYTPKTSMVYCVSVMYWPLTGKTFESLTSKLVQMYGNEYREVTDPAKLRRNTEKMSVWKVMGKETGFVTLSKERSFDNPYTIVYLDDSHRKLYYDEMDKEKQ